MAPTRLFQPKQTPFFESEKVMRSDVWTKPYESRRTFIGGSDARIIMGSDETALIGLWREKRGEADPEDLSGNLVVRLGAATEELNRCWYERNTGRRVTDVQRRVKHSAIPWMAATLDGIVEGTEAVFEAKFMLPWSFSEEAAAEKYMAQVQHNMWVTHLRLGALDHHRRRQMGGDHDSHGPALSQRPGLGGKEVLALRPIRRTAPSHQCRAAAAAHRGHPHRRYERVEFVGGVRRAVPQYPERLS
jgi:YqaJ-like viral recombinase domain